MRRTYHVLLLLLLLLLEQLLVERSPRRALAPIGGTRGRMWPTA